MDAFKSNFQSLFHPNPAFVASQLQADMNVREMAAFFTLLSILIFMVTTMTGAPAGF